MPSLCTVPNARVRTCRIPVRQRHSCRFLVVPAGDWVEMSIRTEVIVFAVALAASLGLTVPIRHLALRFGMVDKPGPRKVHLNPIPLLGGIAIYLGFVLALLFTRHGVPQQQIVGILAGATLLAIVGFLDDGGLLHPQAKLFVGM